MNVERHQMGLNNMFLVYFHSDMEEMEYYIMVVLHLVIKKVMKGPGAQQRLTLVEFISTTKDFGVYVQMIVLKISKEQKMLDLKYWNRL